MSTVHGIREEGAIVGDRKGSRYVLGVTGGWRVKGARKREHQEALRMKGMLGYVKCRCVFERCIVAMRSASRCVRHGVL